MPGDDLQLTHAPSVEVGMLIRRPPGDVFQALVDPAITTRFWFTKRAAASLFAGRPSDGNGRCTAPGRRSGSRRSKTTAGSSSTGAMTTKPRRSSLASSPLATTPPTFASPRPGTPATATRSPPAPLTPPAASPSWFAHSRRYLSTTSSSPSSSMRIRRVFSSEAPQRPPLGGPALHAWCRPSRAGS